MFVLKDYFVLKIFYFKNILFLRVPLNIFVSRGVNIVFSSSIFYSFMIRMLYFCLFYRDPCAGICFTLLLWSFIFGEYVLGP